MLYVFITSIDKTNLPRTQLPYEFVYIFVLRYSLLFSFSKYKGIPPYRVQVPFSFYIVQKFSLSKIYSSYILHPPPLYKVEFPYHSLFGVYIIRTEHQIVPNYFSLDSLFPSKSRLVPVRICTTVQTISKTRLFLGGF